MKLRGSDLVVRALEDAGARFTFGIPGTHNIELYDALERSSSVRAILVTDEQSAGFMADGVSRSSDAIGVANLVPGAGVTHALSGIAEALMDGVPMVVLACGIRTDSGRAFQLHDIDQMALLRPVTKACLKPDTPDAIYATVRRACDLARAGTPGPVAVEIPANFYLFTHDVPDTWTYEPLASARGVADAGVADTGGAGAGVAGVGVVGASAVGAGMLAAAADLLNAARRVLLYVGNGARGAGGAGGALVALAEKLGAPVATTIQGKGVFPEEHPLFLWNGLGAAAPPFVREAAGACDVMLAIGCRFSEVGTGSWGFTPPPTLIHVDINPAVFDRNFPSALAIEADAATFVAALVPRVEARGEWGDFVEHIAVGHRDLRESWLRDRSSTGVTPSVLFETLQRITPNAIYTTDSGNGTFLGMEHLRLNAPGRFLAPVDFSCMGYAVPAAIGAKLANPDVDVVALPGDGALLMTGLELVTAASYGLGIVCCVLRDGELAQIAQFQRTALGEVQNSVLPEFKVEPLAAAVGAAYRWCKQDAHLHAVLEDAFAVADSGKPVVVEIAIDYSRKTFFTQGVVKTTFWRLPWRERLRMLARAVGRNLRRLE